MAAYFFHATDGSAVEFDQVGAQLTGPRAAQQFAATRACALMVARGPSRDWSTWEIQIYNGQGRRVETLPFSEADVPALHTPAALARRMTVQNLGRLAQRVRAWGR